MVVSLKPWFLTWTLGYNSPYWNHTRKNMVWSESPKWMVFPLSLPIWCMFFGDFKGTLTSQMFIHDLHPKFSMDPRPYQNCHILKELPCPKHHFWYWSNFLGCGSSFCFDDWFPNFGSWGSFPPSSLFWAKLAVKTVPSSTTVLQQGNGCFQSGWSQNLRILFEGPKNSSQAMFNCCFGLCWFG